MALNDEILKLKETKLAFKNIIQLNGLEIDDNTKFSDYPKMIEQIINKYKTIIELNNSNYLTNITNNIDNIGSNNRTLYYSQFINLKYILKEGDRVEVMYKSLTNANGFVLGTNKYKIKTKQSTDYIKDILYIDNTDNLPLYIFGYNDNTDITKDESLISIKYIKIYNKLNKLIFNLLPYFNDNKYGLLDILSNNFYVNEGTGHDFYEYIDLYKESYIFYDYENLLK